LPDEAGLHVSPVLRGELRAAPEIRAPLGFPRALALRHVTNYIFFQILDASNRSIQQDLGR
jgi:hypothetical protein